MILRLEQKRLKRLLLEKNNCLIAGFSFKQKWLPVCILDQLYLSDEEN